MVCPYKQNIESLKQTFCTKQGISSIKGHPEHMLYDLTKEFYKFLKKNDFKQLEGEEVYFAD
jgi:hypothetical protein